MPDEAPQPKDQILRIRCTKTTVKDFTNLTIDHDFKNYEDTLKALIRTATNHPTLFKHQKEKIRWG